MAAGKTFLAIYLKLNLVMMSSKSSSKKYKETKNLRKGRSTTDDKNDSMLSDLISQFSADSKSRPASQSTIYRMLKASLRYSFDSLQSMIKSFELLSKMA